MRWKTRAQVVQMVDAGPSLGQGERVPRSHNLTGFAFRDHRYNKKKLKFMSKKKNVHIIFFLCKIVYYIIN
jgi:hypothetical protein